MSRASRPRVYSVTSTDAVGNPTTQTGTIAVSAPKFAAPSLSGKKLAVDKKGRVRPKVRCPKTAACKGTLLLSLSIPSSAIHLKKAAKAALLLGRVSFSAKAGKAKRLSIRLPSPVLRRLSRSHRLKAAVTLQGLDQYGRSSTRTKKVTLTKK